MKILFNYKMCVQPNIFPGKGWLGFIIVLLTMLLIFMWFRFIYYTGAKTAYEGYSPIGIVYKDFLPANFVRDFPSGTENYKKSAFTYVYIAAYKYFGIAPETMIPIVMAFEIGFIAWTLGFLTRTLFPQAHMVIVFLVIVLFLGSYVKELDLGRVGVYLEGKVNNVGDMLRLLAIAFTLRGRIILAGALLGLSFAVNPLMAFIGGVFLISCVAEAPRRRMPGKTLAGAALFLALSVSWMLLMFESSNITGGAIPQSTWFDISRMNSFHWFPVEFGLFTSRHDERFIPLLSFMILFFYCLPRPLRDMDRKVLAGMIAMVGLIAIGAIVPTLDISQALVKLNLVRADEILIAIGLIYIVNRLFDIIISDSTYRMAVALGIAVSPFLVKPGFPLLLTLVLVVPALVKRKVCEWTAGDYSAATLAIVTAAVMGYYALAGMTGTVWLPAYTGGKALLAFVVVLAAIGAITKLSISKWKPVVTIASFLLIVSIASVYWVIRQKPADAYLNLAENYRQVQVWARTNTQENALFMVDPTIYYGWREFSGEALSEISESGFTTGRIPIITKHTGRG